MTRQICTLLLPLLWLTSCGPAEVPRAQEARQRFEAFQQALLAGDRAALRDLMCFDARPAIAPLCEKQRPDQQPLAVTGVTRRNYDYLVHVSDPAAPERRSHYVMTVENGVMRVDLRATVRDGSFEQRQFLEEARFVPQKLTPEQIERAAVVDAQSKAAPAAGR